MLACGTAARLSFLAEDSRGLQRMRPVDDCLASLLSIAENPFAEGGYRRLEKCYKLSGMHEEADAVKFLIEAKFGADSSNIIEKQQGHD